MAEAFEQESERWDQRAAPAAPVSADHLIAAALALAELAARFDASVVTGDDARRVTEALTACGRAVGAARLAAAFRAADCLAFPRGDGVGDAADWMARLSGSSRGQAAAELRLADRLLGLEATRRAFAGGRISMTQASVIADLDHDVPGHEQAMLDLAQRSDLASLKAEARRLRQEAIPPDKLAAKRRRARYHRHWVNDLGMVCGSYAVPPEEGVALVNRIDAETDRRVRADTVAANQAAKAHQPYERQTRHQHAADAFLATVAGGGKGKSGRSDVVIVADIRTLASGDDGVGTGCHVVGGGPIPADRAREIIEASDVFIKAAIYDGVEIRTVKHFGRKIPTELLTALRLGDPPLFEGPVCGVEGCGRRWGLQIDHKIPVAAGGTTSRDNLWFLCWLHHGEKTAADRARGWLPPEYESPAGIGSRGRRAATCT